MVQKRFLFQQQWQTVLFRALTTLISRKEFRPSTSHGVCSEHFDDEKKTYEQFQQFQFFSPNEQIRGHDEFELCPLTPNDNNCK